MKHELNDLIQEIINFGDVIALTDNPDDCNTQHACKLFSSYLEHRFKEVVTRPQLSTVEKHKEWTVDEITQLNDLIALPNNIETPYTQWSNRLSEYCEKLQHNDAAVA